MHLFVRKVKSLTTHTQDSHASNHDSHAGNHLNSSSQIHGRRLTLQHDRATQASKPTGFGSRRLWFPALAAERRVAAPKQPRDRIS